MGLHLRNTLTGELEAFAPRGDVVTLYYCGLTVSDKPHLGHARSWVHVDVLRRYLEYCGHDVRHVENFTDVNEKIVARIGERPVWTDERAVGEYFIEETMDAMRSLNLRRASAYPRVTEHVDAIIELTERLLDAGYAYEANGSVYFDVPAFDGYGQLVDPVLEEDASDHPDKRHPADFALWKAGGVEPADIEEHVKDDDLDLESACAEALTWDSPWGEGRPGWHIECSAMSMTHLDESFDIHVAGRDIAFPHNENEIAQSEAATGQRYASYWVHVDLLEIDEEKMSSSLENFLTVEGAVSEHGSNVIRTFLLSASHDSTQAFNEATLGEAAQRWDRLNRAYDDATEAIDGVDASATVTDGALREAVDTALSAATTALDDNLDTRGALVALEQLSGALHVHLDGTDDHFDYEGLLGAITTFERIGGDILGLQFSQARADSSEIDALLDAILSFRETLRSDGEYEYADAIRELFREHDIEIEDTEDGPRARRPGR